MVANLEVQFLVAENDGAPMQVIRGTDLFTGQKLGGIFVFRGFVLGLRMEVVETKQAIPTVEARYIIQAQFSTIMDSSEVNFQLLDPGHLSYKVSLSLLLGKPRQIL